MKLIKTIRDADFSLNTIVPTAFDERSAARAIVFDKNRNVALLHATKKNYHKLPGGGIEEGEDMQTALRRELSEEIGCSIENIRELGTIEEYRNEWRYGNGRGLHQMSYCFIADLTGDKGAPHLEADEIADGFETVWLSIGDAIQTLKDEANVEDNEGKFIRLRDLTFIQEAAQIK
jgi:8-oxo-dGTP diphosphatase